MPCYRTCICNFTMTSGVNMPCVVNKSSKQNQEGTELRKYWEIWDLRILALYILVSQLYLQFFGRRTKTTLAGIMIKSVLLVYLLSDLSATIALGKLSKLAVNKNSNSTESSINPTPANSNNIPIFNFTIGNATMGDQMLRVMWGPLILFYLGGPDNITVLNSQENKLWMRHLIGLFTQGFRAVYALIATWSYFPQKKLWKGKPWSIEGLISLLALLILIPGLIKYGERVWIIQYSRNKYNKGFIRLNPSQVRVSDSRPNAKRVLLAYFCIQTLMPHCPDYMCDGRRVKDFVRNFLESVRKDSFDAFKLIEIELGLIYDIVFTKVGTIFTLWGSILRFLSLSMIVSVLLVFLKSDKPPPSPGRVFEGDDVITIILIAGAIFLEIAGIVMQLFSDWALVWACSDRIKWATPLLSLHEVLFSKSQRWPEVIGQFSLRDFCKKYNPNACTGNLKKSCFKNCFVQCLVDMALEIFCMGEALKGNKEEKSLGPLGPNVKKIIISYLREKYDPSQTSTQKIAEVDNSKTSTEETGGSDIVADDGKLSTSGVTRGEWTLNKYKEGLEWSIEPLHKSIVIWHVATEVLYEWDCGSDTMNRKAVKMLSDYMMYLLVECPTKFPFCNKYDPSGEDYDHLKELFIREVPSGHKRLENEGDTGYIAKEARKLVQQLHDHPKRWDILASIWAEMVCYAAWRCRVNYHIEELRHGGEFLTRVWLLQMHCDRTLRWSSSSSSTEANLEPGDKRKEVVDNVCECCDCFGSTT